LRNTGSRSVIKVMQQGHPQVSYEISSADCRRCELDAMRDSKVPRRTQATAQAKRRCYTDMEKKALTLSNNDVNNVNNMSGVNIGIEISINQGSCNHVRDLVVDQGAL
jgi:hypothetical protein